MTTRITLAILLTTWAILIVGQTAAFLTAKQILQLVFDETLDSRARSALEDMATGSTDTFSSTGRGDRYVIRDERGEVVQRKEVLRGASAAAKRVRLDFTHDDTGHRQRRISLVLLESGTPRYTIDYYRPTQALDLMLRYLLGIFLLIGLACGLTTAWLALKLSRAALRPLRETANTIAQIDEQNLSRRIEGQKLPVELRPMTDRLNEMLARLEQTFQQRKQFLADAAHELRTPTASLLTTLEVALRRPRDQAALVETLNTGLADARRLRKLVEQLMEQARSERPARPEAMTETDVAAIVRECINIVTPLAAERNIVVGQQLPDSIPFLTERERLRSVVLNLLSNAVEYNNDGGRVDVRCSRDNGAVELIVTDTGKGISAEQLPHVFEPFYRGGEARGDDPSHLGLGLFLVRSHVEALGGRCNIESSIGQGTTLRITLPAKPAV